MQTSIVSARATEPTKIPTTTMLRGICLEDAESLRRVREGLKYYMIHVTIKPWAPELAVLSEEERMVVNGIFGAVRLNKDRFPLLLNAVANFAESGKRKGETVQEAAKSIAELGDILHVTNPANFPEKYDEAELRYLAENIYWTPEFLKKFAPGVYYPQVVSTRRANQIADLVKAAGNEVKDPRDLPLKVQLGRLPKLDVPDSWYSDSGDHHTDDQTTQASASSLPRAPFPPAEGSSSAVPDAPASQEVEPRPVQSKKRKTVTFDPEVTEIPAAKRTKKSSASAEASTSSKAVEPAYPATPVVPAPVTPGPTAAPASAATINLSAEKGVSKKAAPKRSTRSKTPKSGSSSISISAASRPVTADAGTISPPPPTSSSAASRPVTADAGTIPPPPPVDTPAGRATIKQAEEDVDDLYNAEEVSTARPKRSTRSKSAQPAPAPVSASAAVAAAVSSSGSVPLAQPADIGTARPKRSTRSKSAKPASTSVAASSSSLAPLAQPATAAPTAAPAAAPAVPSSSSAPAAQQAPASTSAPATATVAGPSSASGSAPPANSAPAGPRGTKRTLSVADPDAERKCNTCFKKKTIDQFRPRATRPSERVGYCIACQDKKKRR